MKLSGASPLHSIDQTDPDTGTAQPLSAGQLLLRVALGLCALMGALAIPVTYFRAQLMAACQAFVSQAGGVGVALGFLIPDMIPVPFTQDIFTGMAVLGGMAFIEAVAWGSAGSLIGGSIGFFLGRLLGKTPRFKRFVQGRGAEAHILVREKGSWAVAIGAVSPIPYSVVCWSCGALGYPYGRMMLISLLRIPRIAFYLGLIVAGVGWMIGLDDSSLRQP